MGEYSHVSWRGKPMTARQEQALIKAEKRIRRRYWGFRFIVAQGSWQPRTTYSGTTHTKAGVVDLYYDGISDSSRRSRAKARYVLKVLRDHGQAAFYRGPWDNMGLHYHVCDLDTSGMDYNAIWQVGEYRDGNNGLAGGQKDRHSYRPDPIRKYKYVS